LTPASIVAKRIVTPRIILWKNKIAIISIESIILFPTFTPLGREVKELSIKTKSATRRVAGAPSNIEIPKSDFLIARASFTPSPIIPVYSLFF